MNSREIAQTILEQIKYLDHMALMAWGSKHLIALSSEDRPNGKRQIGGLQMTVNGMKFRGQVLIRLMANDTYTIECGTLFKTNWKMKHQLEDVYCEQLVEIIDSLIER